MCVHVCARVCVCLSVWVCGCLGVCSVFVCEKLAGKNEIEKKFKNEFSKIF